MDSEKDINIAICKYIYNNWISTAKSQRQFATDHEIEESTVRKIKNIALGTSKTDYNMTINTLHKICQSRKTSLENFFKLVKE
ncbi:transcriptional regulator [uncultured Chryseobacterium sp.]|uniref:transcriptional regulator n=1 Tax=uncultured Chryseobacterium sp. TaxID=259322 RepID=UPI0025CCE3D0|nr:transcriptional regulator [uncultured Chryseobacterium sp.]